MTTQAVLTCANRCPVSSHHCGQMLIRFAAAALAVTSMPFSARSQAVDNSRPPNIVYIMSDELAYYEVSYMGHPQLQTPRIDRMVAEGLMFTNALAGAPVCAPLRCTLMTGKHAGHASVRLNGGGTPLREGEETIASMLKPLGYATGGFGKWGCGGRGSTGVPEKHGFDVFFGYYDQVHAHSFYPPYLIRNSQEIPLKGNRGGRIGETYSHYEIMNASLEFIRDNKDRPFFCYLPITPPHGMYDIPETDPAVQLYKDKDWPPEARNYAAMVTMVDRNVGEVLDLLKELDLEDNTIVFFAGDNGGQNRFKSKEHPRGFFGPNVNPKTGVEFRAGKGSLYEGGLKIPSLVRWPGRIKPGRVSDLVWYQPDILPTLAELTGAKAPADIDGMSILPEILASSTTGYGQETHKYLYWEFVGQTAVRMDQWKAYRGRGPNAKWELYDLDKDISETSDIAKEHPDILATMLSYADEAHTDVVEGVFHSRTEHERDRWAKYGTSQDANSKPPGKVNLIPPEGLITPSTLKLVRFSSENRGNRKFARNAIDGNPYTIWHTQFQPEVKKHPHELVIDLGARYSVRELRYLARQDNGWNGAIAKCEVYVSDAADGFDEPAAVTTFKKRRTSQSVEFKPVTGRYLMIRALTDLIGQSWASAAEFGIVADRVAD